MTSRIDGVFPVALVLVLFGCAAAAASPGWSEDAKLLASDGGSLHHFGCSVSLSGDTGIVGAKNHESAYVFTRDPANPAEWGEVARLIASDSAGWHYFGQSVSLSGGTAIVGADGGNTYLGAAYLFDKPDGDWEDMTETAKLTASDGVVNDYFGYSISLSGDIAVVGAPGDNDYGAWSGSAYVFSRDEGGADHWGQVAKLTAPVGDAAAFDQFGFAVAISGDTAIIGVEGDSDLASGAGAAYIFEYNGSAWNPVTKLTAGSDATVEGHFGCSVAIDGDCAVVGAYGHDDDGTDSGAAYVFCRNQGGADQWGQAAKLTAADAAEEDYFGWSVSISGDTAILGAKLGDENAADSGAAYVFRGSGTTWSQVAKLFAGDGGVSQEFGYSVALDESTALVGAIYDNDNGTYSGSAYIFSESAGDDLIPEPGGLGLAGLALLGVARTKRRG